MKRVTSARQDRRIKCSPLAKLSFPPKGSHFDKKTGKIFLFGNGGVTITRAGAPGCRYNRGSIECCVFMSKRTGFCALGHNRFVMDPLQQFCLKWNSFSNNLVTTFDNLFRSASLTDVTLFCEGVTFQAHKLILAACSKHFHDLFDSAPMSPNIVVILDGTSASNMAALLEFMYKGEVHVAQERLPSFLKAAEYLQVKGLSEKHDKLDSHHNTPSADMRGDSPTNNRCANPKQLKSLSLSMGTRPEDGGGAGGGRADLAIDSMLPPSSPASNSFPSPYQMTFKTQSAYERTGPYEYRSKRHPRSPSDSQLRASVLRDGSKPERESPLSIGYSPSSVSHHYESLQQQLPPVLTISDGSVAGTGPYERSIKTEKSPSPQNWQHNSNCAEDLRMKSESIENSGTIDENGSDRRYGSGGGLDSSQRDNGDRNPPPQPVPLEGGVPSSPSGSATTPTWTPGMASVKLDQPQKGIPSTTTDGKKLQCPFCERLYGYETNLRAHIRQRHQGIRVPCPFCTRTFTRNNTVRRHIAREHKTELNLKAIQQGQVQNHNQ